MKKNERFFSKFITAAAVFASLSLVCDVADAATRTTTRSAPTTRRNVTVTKATLTQEKTPEPTVEPEKIETVVEPVVERIEQPTLVVTNKSTQFENTVSDVMESALPDNTFAEEIRRQRAALAASEATMLSTTTQQRALSANSHSCDVGLRKCMSEICGKDFTKCALDGDTAFGDKLNRCRKNTECSAEEFSAFVAEIKADRDANVRLASYNAVLDCGNNYNACIMNECGTTYNKCLGKSTERAAIQKCSVIAKECQESDSGLAARFGTAMGKLRENAETDVKKDENRLYELRDLMANSCKSLGATFDERTFDCVYTVNFYAGENQSAPLASRKVYAGDSFVCMPEWFGTDVTTYRENAYRETRAQTAASSAMLGSGLGVGAGAISSGGIDRAIDTNKAKNALKDECSAQGGKLKNGECVQKETDETKPAPSGSDKQTNISKDLTNIITGNTEKKNEKCAKVENALTMKHDENGKCIVATCNLGYKKNDNASACVETAAKTERETKRTKRKSEKEETKAAKEACNSRGGQYKDDGCYCNKVLMSDTQECDKGKIKTATDTASNTSKKQLSDNDCTNKVAQAKKATYNASRDCIVETCNDGYHISTNKRYCIQNSSSGSKKQSAPPTQTLNKEETGQGVLTGSIAPATSSVSGLNLANGMHSHLSSDYDSAHSQQNGQSKETETKTLEEEQTPTNSSETSATTTPGNTKTADGSENTSEGVEVYDVIVIDDTKNTQKNSQTLNTSSSLKIPESDNNQTKDVVSYIAIANLNEINVSKDGVIRRAKNMNKSCEHIHRITNYNGVDINYSNVNCDNISPGQWDVVFDYGRITGISKCSDKAPDDITYTGNAWNGRQYYKTSFKVGTPGNTPGIYCYCNITGPSGTNWVNQPIEGNDCNNRCSGMCAFSAEQSEAFRKALFDIK